MEKIKPMTPYTEIFLPKTKEGKGVIRLYIIPLVGQEEEAAKLLKSYVDDFIDTRRSSGYNLFRDETNPYHLLIVEGIQA